MKTDWITVISFTYPHEAHLAKASLESEGIEVRIKDEFTAQVHNFYSNAIGGVKLQVQKEEVEKALLVLKSKGYILESDRPKDSTSFLTELDQLTSKLPWLGQLLVEVRLLAIVVLLLLIIVLSFIPLLVPSTAEKLIAEEWCIDAFQYKDKHYQPSTAGVKLVYTYGCEETIRFNEEGIVVMPGFNSLEVMGRWKLKDDYLVIFDSDTLAYVYDGVYLLDIGLKSLEITSENTRIKGHSQRPVW